MTFEEAWNNKLKYYSSTDYQLCKSIWELAQSELDQDNSKFDSWWGYHSTSHKHWISNEEQAARWAWIVQQSKIDKLERELEQLKTSNL